MGEMLKSQVLYSTVRVRIKYGLRVLVQVQYCTVLCDSNYSSRTVPVPYRTKMSYCKSQKVYVLVLV